MNYFYYNLLFYLIFYNYYAINAAIIPQELPSVLSLVYSNIPPIKKGTDSRVGFGFRLGEHADFQVLFELGPQTNTRPIGQPTDSDSLSDTSKRQVNQNDYNAFKSNKIVEKKSPNKSGSNWLTSWSNEMKSKTGQSSLNTKDKGTISTTSPSNHQRQQLLINNNNNNNNNGNNLKQTSNNIIAIKPLISESALKQLQQLYNTNNNNNNDNKGQQTESNTRLIIDDISQKNVQFYPIPSQSTLTTSTINTNKLISLKPHTHTEKKKITADLMDIEFDD